MECVDRPGVMDQWFLLHFSSCSTITARVNEEFITSAFYTNEEVVEPLGQEMCICLDVCLAGSGCEAIVEGFYSVIGAHKKSGGQSNQSLAQRAIVDWTLPHPAACPATTEEIAKIYKDGNEEHQLPRHRDPVFTDERQRSIHKYFVSKVVDRVSSHVPRCPHVLHEQDK